MPSYMNMPFVQSAAITFI